MSLSNNLIKEIGDLHKYLYNLINAYIIYLYMYVKPYKNLINIS